jgi:serine/threonine protein kinase
MGTVYKGRDRKSGELVALKLVGRPDLHGRFMREGRVLSTMRHQNIVRYVGHGVEPTGEPWLAMEWLEGEELCTRLDRGPLSIADTIAVANGLAQGLAWAHKRGFVHRDVQPGNLFLPDGDLSRIKILDFGLARLLAHVGEFTATGITMGPLAYMPPEQVLDAKRADARSDIFSFGAVLFHCLAGRPPSAGESTSEILANVLSAKAPPVRELRSDAPVELASLIDRMLSRAPEERPADGAAVLAALARMPVESSWESLMTLPMGVEATEVLGVSAWAKNAPVSLPELGAKTEVMVEESAVGADPFADTTVGTPARSGPTQQRPRTEDREGLHYVPVTSSVPGPAEWLIIVAMASARALIVATFLLFGYELSHQLFR